MVKPEGYKPLLFKEEPVNRPMQIPMVVIVGRSTLIAAIRDAGIDVPANAEVTFRVPGGGDYSNTDVELDDKHQVVTVRYKR